MLFFDDLPMSPLITRVLTDPTAVQLLAVLLLWSLAFGLAAMVRKFLPHIDQPKLPLLKQVQSFFSHSLTLLIWFVLLVFLIYGLESEGRTSQLVSLTQSLIGALIVVRYALGYLKAQVYAKALIYTVVPLILLNAFDVLTPAINALEAYALNVGNIHFSIYDLCRVLYFGAILFWLGKESSRLGKKTIRSRTGLDSSTKEVIAKLFEVLLYVVMFLVLLNVLGISLTTLTVLGGAIGVGIGFGLQSIASNFVSGLIILLERSLSIGDYIELADSRGGTIRDVNLRSITLETFDGKDIVVPNDVFFSTTFTNWTHKNLKQRYDIDFAVAFSTDLDRLFPLVKAILCAHKSVLSGADYSFEEQPDIEISGFGDNGINLHIEFWMNAIDDGENRVGADLLYEIWKLMNQNGFSFPFPQREVRMLSDK
jgi:small-conductance mechanosensitive channel